MDIFNRDDSIPHLNQKENPEIDGITRDAVEEAIREAITDLQTSLNEEELTSIIRQEPGSQPPESTPSHLEAITETSVVTPLLHALGYPPEVMDDPGPGRAVAGTDFFLNLPHSEYRYGHFSKTVEISDTETIVEVAPLTDSIGPNSPAVQNVHQLIDQRGYPDIGIVTNGIQWKLIKLQIGDDWTEFKTVADVNIAPLYLKHLDQDDGSGPRKTNKNILDQFITSFGHKHLQLQFIEPSDASKEIFPYIRGTVLAASLALTISSILTQLNTAGLLPTLTELLPVFSQISGTLLEYLSLISPGIVVGLLGVLITSYTYIADEDPMPREEAKQEFRTVKQEQSRANEILEEQGATIGRIRERIERMKEDKD